MKDNQALHAHLEKIGYPHEYLEAPGAHEWGYWDVHVQEAIAFHARNLGLEKVKPKVVEPARTREGAAKPAPSGRGAG